MQCVQLGMLTDGELTVAADPIEVVDQLGFTGVWEIAACERTPPPRRR